MGIHAAMARWFLTPTFRDSIRSLLAHSLFMARYLHYLGIISEIEFTHLKVSGYKVAGRYVAYVNRYFSLASNEGSAERNGTTGISLYDGESLSKKINDILSEALREMRYKGFEMSLYWRGKILDKEGEGYIKIRSFGSPGTRTNGHIEIDILGAEGINDDIILGDLVALSLKEGVVGRSEIGRFFENWLHGWWRVDVSDVKGFLEYSRLQKVVIAYEDEPLVALSRRYGMGLRTTRSVPREVYESLKSCEELRTVDEVVSNMYKILDVIRLNRLHDRLYDEPSTLVRISREVGLLYVSAGSFVVIDEKPLRELVIELARHYSRKLSDIEALKYLPSIWDALVSGGEVF